MFAFAFAQSAAEILPGVHTFVDFVTTLPSRLTLSESLHRACGDPCVYDFVMHTETLELDFVNLLSNLGLPLIGLARMNPTRRDQPERGPPPVAEFTQGVLDVIHRVDGWVFTEFGYTRRLSPFEL